MLNFLPISSAARWFAAELGLITVEVLAIHTLSTGGLRAATLANVSPRLKACRNSAVQTKHIPVPSFDSTHAYKYQKQARRPLIPYVPNAAPSANRAGEVVAVAAVPGTETAEVPVT